MTQQMQCDFRTADKGLNGTLSKLEDLNGRLQLKVDPDDVLAAIHRVSTDPQVNTMLLQPKATSYCWSDRTIVALMVARADQHVRVRMRRARSYHGGAVSPSLWPEMKAFPKGDAGSKLTRWTAVADGAWIPIEVAQTCPPTSLSCQYNEWSIDWTPTQPHPEQVAQGFINRRNGPQDRKAGDALDSISPTS